MYYNCTIIITSGFVIHTGPRANGRKEPENRASEKKLTTDLTTFFVPQKMYEVKTCFFVLEIR